jgi:hypothetical protein
VDKNKGTEAGGRAPSPARSYAGALRSSTTLPVSTVYGGQMIESLCSEKDKKVLLKLFLTKEEEEKLILHLL